MTSYGAVEANVQGVTEIFAKIANSYFNTRSIVTLVVSLLTAYLLGRLTAAVLRRVVTAIGRQADKAESLQMVNRLRRYETTIILSIAVIRTVLFLFALYFWWVTVRGDQQQTAVIGASALAAIIIGAVFTPLLRDISSGSIMMAEQWYAVGDYVRLEPFADMQGVVERVTLRSTRIRGLNGEVIWVNNQNIQAVRITPKGVRTMAVEVFVKDLKKGEELIESTNRRLPTGPLLVISPLEVMTASQVGEKLWHITALAETAPGREWLIEKYTIEVMREIDQDKEGNLQNLATEPVARYADSETERRFSRAIQNASKAPKPKKSHLRKLGR
jgi:moderate conductance mechanosensitive channel